MQYILRVDNVTAPHQCLTILAEAYSESLRQIEVFPLIEQLDPDCQLRESIPFLQFVLVYLMKVIGSIPKMEPVWELLLTDELLMSLCGFNAYQVRNCSCERGQKRRTTPVPDVRGAICVDTLAEHIVEITPRRLENFFNRMIQRLAEARVFPKYIHAAGDTTEYEKTDLYEGCGRVSRERKAAARGYRNNGEIRKVKVTVLGDLQIQTGMPLAIKIDTIEKPDNRRRFERVSLRPRFRHEREPERPPEHHAATPGRRRGA